MKRTSFYLFTSVMVVAVLLTAGCAKPPAETIESARSALAEVEAADAATYAPEALASAREALAAAQAEVDAQNAKFALFRSYKHAEELFAEAQTQAGEAVRAAVDGKAAVKAAAEEAVEAGRAAVTQAQDLIAALEACPRKPKGFAGDMEILKGQVQGLVDTLPTLDDALSAESFASAQSQAETVRAQAETLVVDLEGARTKLGC